MDDNKYLDYTFRGQRSNEQVILVARFHKWLLMPIAYFWLVVLAASLTIVYYLGATTLSSSAVAGLVLVALLYSLYQWFLWNGGNYIITNQRVIRTEQISLFKRQIAEAEIDRIQEISTQISGPIHTLFRFGTVRIRTASGGDQVDIEDVASPYDIQQEIARVQRQLTESGQIKPSVNRPKGLS